MLWLPANAPRPPDLMLCLALQLLAAVAAVRAVAAAAPPKHNLQRAPAAALTGTTPAVEGAGNTLGFQWYLRRHLCQARTCT